MVWPLGFPLVFQSRFGLSLKLLFFNFSFTFQRAKTEKFLSDTLRPPFFSESSCAVLLLFPPLEVRFSFLLLPSFFFYCSIISDYVLPFISLPLLVSVFLFLWGFSLYRISLPFDFCISMVDSLEVRIACPSISFLFARLGGSLGTYPFLENFSNNKFNPNRPLRS